MICPVTRAPITPVQEAKITPTAILTYSPTVNNAASCFGYTYPGQTGGRNQLRGPGYFGIDLGMSKRWQMPWSDKQSLQFRWETFNVTNSVRLTSCQATPPVTWQMAPDRISATSAARSPTRASCSSRCATNSNLNPTYEDSGNASSRSLFPSVPKLLSFRSSAVPH